MNNNTSGSPLRAVLQAIDRTTAFVERWVLIASILLMAAMNIANVVARNLFNNSLTFSQDVNQILIILVTFLGIGYAARRARHIRMSAFYDQLTGKSRKGLLLVILVGTAALMFVLCYYSLQYTLQQYRYGGSTPALQIPWWTVYLWVPVGFLLAGIQYVLAVIRNLITPGAHLSFEEKDEYDESASYL